MILVWGGLDDPPVALVMDALRERGVAPLHVDRSTFDALPHEVRFDAGGVSGWMDVGGRRVDVETIRGIYLRPQSQREPLPASSCLLALAAAADAVVVNRPAAGRANLAKPVQLAAIAAAGFEVPQTLVTTNPAAARAFLQRHGRIVYKSISGVRSIVNTLEPGDAARLDGVRTGPVQLQRWIAGTDVRVHVVGRRCFATAIESAAVDYRYGGGLQASFSAIDLDGALAARLADLAASMDLLLAGIDLRRTPDGRWVCFEVNPSPGFSFYEEATGQPIGGAVADLLLSGGR